MTDLQMLKNAVQFFAGHYCLPEWAAVMGQIQRELPAIIAEIEAARNDKSGAKLCSCATI